MGDNEHRTTTTIRNPNEWRNTWRSNLLYNPELELVMTKVLKFGLRITSNFFFAVFVARKPHENHITPSAK